MFFLLENICEKIEIIRHNWREIFICLWRIDCWQLAIININDTIHYVLYCIFSSPLKVVVLCCFNSHTINVEDLLPFSLRLYTSSISDIADIYILEVFWGHPKLPEVAEIIPTKSANSIDWSISWRVCAGMYNLQKMEICDRFTWAFSILLYW